jgi:5-methylcytosine-specific restriction endonuclease McrA
VKSCSKCKIEKDLSCFSTNKKAKDGLHSWCRECVNFDRRLKCDKYRESRRKYAAKNAEKIAKREKIYKSTEEFRKKKLKWDRKYREKNRDVIRLKKFHYYSDKQHLRRAEYQRNKEGYIARAYARLRKIKNFTPEDADKLLIKRLYKEASRLTIETGIKHEVDHIIPVSKGGLHHQDNLQILVWLENRRKGNKIMDMRKK